MKQAFDTKRLTVGLLGNSIRGLIAHSVESAGYDTKWRIVDLEPSRAIQEKCDKGSFVAKIRKRLYIAKAIAEIDVLCVVYVSSKSLLYARIAHTLGKKVVYYWLGSDVYSLLKGELKESVARGKGIVDLHLAYGANLVEELAPFGVSAKVLVTPATLSEVLSPMPSRHSVLLSIPDARKDFYGYEPLIRLVKDFPDVPFHAVRTAQPDLYDLPNIVVEGVLSPEEMEKVFDEVSIVIRYPEHDGTSLILMESLFKGKYLISKHEFPHAVLARTYEELVEALSEALKRPLEPSLDNHEYANNYFTQKAAGKKWNEMLSSLFAA